MKKLNQIGLGEEIVATDELDGVVSVVNNLNAASASLQGKSFFLTANRYVPLIVEGSLAGSQFLVSGKIYQCVMYYYLNPITGRRTEEYKWEQVTFKENGKLRAISTYNISVIENASSQGGGCTVKMNWVEQADVVNALDGRDNAVWAYTIVVRKRGSTMPKTPYDGDVVGYSSKRNQYQGALSFYDYIPDSNYKYNIFEVTRYGIATGLGDSGGTETDWIRLRDSIRDGTSGLFLGAVITVQHEVYGDLDLQVVDMRENDSQLRVDTRYNPHKRSVVFMSLKALPRSAFDVPELAENGGVVNPADKDMADDKVSLRGRSRWAFSNLRLWLNQGTHFKTTDTSWNSRKRYFRRSVDPDTGDYLYTEVKTAVANPSSQSLYEMGYIRSIDTVYNVHKMYYTWNEFNDAYELAPIPITPGSVNPSAEGYWESTWVFQPANEIALWDVKPDPFNAARPDAGYSYGDRLAPGFLSGFSQAFQTVLATVDVRTITDPFTAQHGTEAGRSVVTQDKIFIPSYRELYGNEPPGISTDSRYANHPEGKHFDFFNSAVKIPDLSLRDRSLLKFDLDAQLCGYYLRTVETRPVAGTTGRWYIGSPSGLWTVKSTTFTDRPPLGVDVFATNKCALTASEAKEKDALGTLVAPGIAWCCVIG